MNTNKLVLGAVAAVCLITTASVAAQARPHSWDQRSAVNVAGDSCHGGSTSSNFNFNSSSNFNSNFPLRNSSIYPVSYRPSFDRRDFNGVNGNQFRSGQSIDRQQASVNARIQRGIAAHRLTPGEARRLLALQSRIDTMQARFGTTGNGINRAEYAKLQNEVTRLRFSLNHELNDRNIY